MAKGFTQEYGIDNEEMFAPMAHLTSVRSLIVVAIVKKVATFSDGCEECHFEWGSF